MDAERKKVIGHRGDMIFTHFGLSGPIALRCSQFIRQVKKKFKVNEVDMAVDLFPDLPPHDLDRMLRDKLGAEPKKAIKNVLKAQIPERMLPLLMNKASLDGDATFAHLPKQQWASFIDILKKFVIRVTGTKSIEEAFVTAWRGEPEGNPSENDGIQADAGSFLLRRDSRHSRLHRRV